MFIEQKVDGLVEKINKLEEDIASLRKEISAQNKAILVSRDIQRLATIVDLEINVPLTESKIFTSEFIDTVYEFELKNLGGTLNQIMGIVDSSFTHGERSSPADPWFISSGYFKTMLKRYIFAGKIGGDNAKILDGCCGRGWGTRILSEYADHITAYDIEPKVIAESKKYWKAKNIDWIAGDGRDLNFLGDKKFDVATFMESIEHFTKEDGIKIICETVRVLKDKAIFIGTSFFPDTRHHADNHASIKRDDHHYLWTKDELREELNKHFTMVHIINSWMFVAIR